MECEWCSTRLTDDEEINERKCWDCIEIMEIQNAQYLKADILYNKGDK